MIKLLKLRFAHLFLRLRACCIMGKYIKLLVRLNHDFFHVWPFYTSVYDLDFFGIRIFFSLTQYTRRWDMCTTLRFYW